MVATIIVCMQAAAARAVVVSIGSARGQADQEVTFKVSLASEGASVAGVQNDLSFNKTFLSFPVAPTGTGTCSVTTTTPCVSDGNCPQGETCVRNDGPACQAAEGLTGKNPYFSFVGDNIRNVTVGIDPQPNTDPMPQNTQVYTCRVKIAAGTPNGSYPLAVPGGSAIASNPTGEKLAPVNASTGYILVGPITCVGDLDGSGSVEPVDVAKALDGFFNDNADQNPAADCNENQTIDPVELAQVLNNFFNDVCNPCTA